MARDGWDVTVIEKNSIPGGRASQLKLNGFTFDTGPSWYWMPDVFERYFEKFGKRVEDYYKLTRLDPSYRVYWQNEYTDIPADFSQLKLFFESIEQGGGISLEKYITEAEYKYDVGVRNLVYKPARSLSEYFEWPVIKGMYRLDIFNSISKHIAKYFHDPRLRQLMEFPVLFLGALPKDTPALYSLMNYADMKGGTWYPQGGMYAVVEAMYKLALEFGVKFRFNESVEAVDVKHNTITSVRTNRGSHHADTVISSADYHFTENVLLPESHRSYSSKYWNKKVLAPSCLLYYVGVNKKLDLPHHSLFFDVPFDKHGREIYSNISWPSEPLFYVSANSITDPAAAPPGKEALVFLIPVASGLEHDDEDLRARYFNTIVERFEKRTGQGIRGHIECMQTFSVSDFVREYNSFKGNAYGLANTLRQTAIFRPKCKSKKLKNLYYAGQLTVPGPGVPPCIISGEVVAGEILKDHKNGSQ